MKKIIKIFIFLFLFYFISNRKKTSDKNEKFIKFITGMGVGYGLSVEATEDLKNCFLNKQNSNNLIQIFLNKSSKNVKRKEILKIDSELKEVQEKKAKNFTKEVLDFFAHFKDCAPFRETFFSFVKTRLINIGVKGLAYAVGGVIGVLLKSGYNLYKLISEIKNFYLIRSKNSLDYFQLGSTVGKIVYYTQNLVLRRRLKRRLKKY
jgi:hypothetical protein